MDKHFALFHCEKWGRGHSLGQTGGYCQPCRELLGLSPQAPVCVCCAQPLLTTQLKVQSMCYSCFKNNAGRLIPDWK